MRKRLILTVTTLLLFVVFQSLVSAQTPPARVFFEREFFTLGGRSDNVLIFPELYRDLPVVVKDALLASFAVYQPMFGAKSGTAGQTPFQVVVWFTDNPSRQVPDVIADSGISPRYLVVADMPVGDDLVNILDDSVCYIRIFGQFLRDSAHQQADIAHEYAHCYQYFYNSSGTRAKAGKNWWLEGGADWLASIVYPAQFPAGRHSKFRMDFGILTQSYQNLHFWAYMASPEAMNSNQALVDFMMSIPEDYQDHDEMLQDIRTGLDPSNVFHDWVLSLVKGRVPFQPNLGLSGTEYKSGSAGHAGFSTGRFTGDRGVVTDIQVDDGFRAMVVASNTEDNNYGVSIKVDGEWRRLRDGTALDFCPEPGGLEVLFSRANAEPGNRAEFTLTFTQDDSSPRPPCTPKPPEATPATACIVGVWVVTAFPPSILGGNDFKVNMSDYVYFFHADGTYTGEYDISAHPGDGSVLEIDIPFEGTYSVTAVEGAPGTYAVQGFTMRVLPGGTASLVTAGGQTADLADTYYRAFAREGLEAWYPQGEILCNEDDMTWSIGPGAHWTLARLED